MLTKEQKNELIRTYGKNEHDSGSTEVQIALLTARIVYLTEHFKQQPKDFPLAVGCCASSVDGAIS